MALENTGEKLSQLCCEFGCWEVTVYFLKAIGDGSAPAGPAAWAAAPPGDFRPEDRLMLTMPLSARTEGARPCPLSMPRRRRAGRQTRPTSASHWHHWNWHCANLLLVSW